MRNDSSDSGASSQVLVSSSPKPPTIHSAISIRRGVGAGLPVPDSDRIVIDQEAELALLWFLERDIPVYLEGFGILFPERLQSQKTSVVKDKVVVRSDESRTIGFEKCYDLIAFHRERYRGVVEPKEIAAHIHARSSHLLSSPLAPNTIRRTLRALIDDVKAEVVVSGFSPRLSAIGDFYALHNRQGKSFADWYAGADVFLKSRYQQTLKTGEPRFLERPVLESPWEPFSALYGAPLQTLSLDLLFELKELGYDTAQMAQESSLGHGAVKIGVFLNTDSDNGETVLSYVSDGLRHIGIQKGKGKGKGTEFVVQLAVRSTTTSTGLPLTSADVPCWPLRLFTLGWILLQSSKNGAAKPGAGLSSGGSLVTGFDSDLGTAFTTSLSRLRTEQLSPEGPFTYLNLVGITEDEAAVASRYSALFLTNILNYKKLDQITRPTRSSIVAKTGLLETPESGGAVLESSLSEPDDKSKNTKELPISS